MSHYIAQTMVLNFMACGALVFSYSMGWLVGCVTSGAEWQQRIVDRGHGRFVSGKFEWTDRSEPREER